MDKAVFFLDGDNKGQLIGGIPDHLREWRTLIPADVIWCGDSECCDRNDIEDRIVTYYLVDLGRMLRVATQDKNLAENRDKLMWQVAFEANYLYARSVDAMYHRRVEQAAPTESPHHG